MLLRDRLLAAGYTPDGVGQLLGPQAHAALGRGDRVPALRRLDEGGAGLGGPAGELAALVRLFLLRGTEPAGQVPWLPPPYVTRGPQGVRAALDLRPYGTDSFVVSDLDVGPDSVTGVGGASLTLAGATVPGQVTRALDVGTGSGVQALHLAARAGQVVATDSNPRCLQLARATLELSGVGNVELRAGDLLAPVSGERFDLVVSNPPFVVGPPRLPRLSYRDSGLGGDELCARLTRGLAGVLRPGGVGQLLANWLHVRGQDWRERVAGWLPAGCDAWVLQREVQDPAQYAGLWLRDGGADRDPARFEELFAAWLDDFAGRGVEAVGFGVITVRRTGGPGRVLIEEARQPADGPLGPEIGRWLAAVDALRGGAPVTAVPAPGLRREQVAVPGPGGWVEVDRVLVGGPPLHWRAPVDPVAEAFLAACDGRTGMAEAARAAARAGAGEPADLLRLGQALLERGYLHQVPGS